MHPSNVLGAFHELLNQNRTTANNSGSEAHIAGYINIKFLNYLSNNLTSDYLDVLFEQLRRLYASRNQSHTYHLSP